MYVISYVINVTIDKLIVKLRNIHLSTIKGIFKLWFGLPLYRFWFLQRFPFLYRDINKVSRGIFFDYDKSELKPEVTQFILPEVITELIKRPSLRILIEGHADEDGSAKYNLALSMRRAQAVADYLIASGISANRIDVQGLGEGAPAVQGSDDDARARNRRAVILEQK